MKKFQLLITATLITIAVNAQNLLTNPDFEIWSGGVPTGWTLGTTGTVSQSAITSTGVGSAFQIAGPASTYSISQNVLPPNGAATFDTTSVYKITITYLVKAGDGTDARIWSNLMTSTALIYNPVTHNDSMLYYIPLHGPGGNINPTVPGNDMNGYLLDNRATGTWHTYSYSFKFRAGISQFAFMVRSYIASTVIWDNFYFGKATIADTQAPMPPTGLKNTPPIDNSFYLSWNAAVDNVGVTSYDVYKDSVYYGSSSTLGLTITGLTPGTTCKMTVKAKDAAGNLSLASMPLTVTNPTSGGVTLNVTVPSGTYQCWIVGSFNGWLNNLNQMTKIDNTHYTITLNESSFPAGVTKANMEYKYCSGGGDWAYVEKNADGSELLANHKYSDSNGNDVVLRWAVTYTNTPPLPMNVTIDVLTPVGTKECYIVGNFNNWAGPTAPADSCKMLKIATNQDGTIIFEKRIYTADANKLQYHFCSGPDWSFEQSAPSGDYKYPDAAVVVTEWKAVYDPTKTGTIRINATVPNGTQRVWIVGSFQGWDMTKPIEGIRNASGTFSFTVPKVMSIGYRMYNKPDWAYSEVGAANPTVDLPARGASYPADSVTNITIWGWRTAIDSIADTTAPTIPTGLKSTPPANNSFYLSWNSSIDNVGVTGYEVYKDSIFYGSTSNLGLDVSGLTPGKIYKMTVRAKDAAGNLSSTSMPLFVTNPNAGGLTYQVTVPIGTKTCFIAGTMNNWIQQPMIRVDSTHFKIESATALPTDEYKYCSGPDWMYEELNGAGNVISNRTYSPTDVVLEWRKVYDPAILPIEKDVTINVTVSDSVKVCYLVGSFNSWATPNDSTKMQKNILPTGKVVFSKTIHTKDANTLQFRFCAGPDWMYEQSNPAYNFTYPGDQSTVSVTVISFKAIYNPKDSITDHLAPTIPTGLKNGVPTTNSFNFTWHPSTDNVAVVSYKVYRDSMFIGTTPTPYITITDLTPGKTYKMTVIAVDAAGNNSGFSAPLFVTTKTGTTTEVTFKVTVPAGTYQCWLVGNFNNWNNNLNQMMKVDSTHYTITLDESTFAPGVKKDSLQYKYVSGGGDWAFVEKDSLGGEIQDRHYTTGVDVVQKWAFTYNPNIPPLPMDVTINVKTPAGTVECYIVGNFNNWEGPTAQGSKMTKVTTNPDGTVMFTLTGHVDDANRLAYRFCSGPDWFFEQKAPEGDYKYPVLEPVVTEWKAIYDPSKIGSIKIQATVPSGTQNVWIIGSYTGWDMTKAIAGTKNSNGTFSFAIPNIMAMEYKLFNQPDWNYAETDSTGNIRANRIATFPADSVANITVLGWKQTVDTVNISGITVKIGSGGIVNQNNTEVYDGAVLSVAKGSMLTFNIIPNIGYEVETMKLNGVDVKAQLINNKFTTPAINGNVILNVTFRKMMFSLAIRSAESGTLELFCEFGATPTFRFTPSTNWRINAVSYNNIDVTSYLTNGIFTLPPVYSNAMLNVSFEYLATLNTAPANSNVKVYTSNSEIIIDGIKPGEIIRLYSENGAQLKALKSQGYRITIPDLPNAIYLIKTETKTVKVIL